MNELIKIESRELAGETIQTINARDLWKFVESKHKTTFSALARGTLSKEQIKTIDTVLKAYGDKSPQWLSDQTHAEEPWRTARQGLTDHERDEKEITLSSMAEYYSTLYLSANG